MPASPVPAPRDDQTLIARCNQGDAGAFEQLYYQYRDWVYRLALRFTCDPQDALDVLQETFSYLLRKFPGFVLTANLTTFLYPVVKNTSIRIREKRRRVRLDEDVLENVPAGSHQHSDFNADLHSILAGLPDAHREVVLMRFVDDMALDEIATALCVPLGTVKSRLHHAINNIRNDPRAAGYFREPD